MKELFQQVLSYCTRVKDRGTVGTLQTIIIYCERVLIASVVISVICEFNNTEHSGWIQFVENYAIGIACSVVIVIVTTIAQFYAERNKYLNKYLTDSMILSHALYAFKIMNDKKGKEEIRQFAERLINEIQNYNYFKKELYWFNKSIDDQYIRVHEENNFLVFRLKSAPEYIYYLTYNDIKNFIVGISDFYEMVYSKKHNFLHDIAVQVQLEAREEAKKD